VIKLVARSCRKTARATRPTSPPIACARSAVAACEVRIGGASSSEPTSNVASCGPRTSRQSTSRHAARTRRQLHPARTAPFNGRSSPSGATPGSPDAETDDDDETVRPLSDRLVTELTAHRTLALRDAVANDPHVAFQAVLHAPAATLICMGKSLLVVLRHPSNNGDLSAHHQRRTLAEQFCKRFANGAHSVRRRCWPRLPSVCFALNRALDLYRTGLERLRTQSLL
jgi:hypothetical protein